MSSFPCVFSEVLEGTLGTLGGRTGGLLCKLSVGQNMNASILAALAEMDLEDVEHLRGQCRSNG